MAKFDFNNSRYARLFSDSDVRFLQTYIDNAAMLEVNHGWWMTQFKKADQVTPTADDGTATFTVKARKLEVAPLMDIRDRLGDSMPLDNEGVAFYSATVPDFIAPGIVEKAPERYSKEQMFEEFGNDRDILLAWTQKLQERYDSANSTLTYMGAKLMSEGKIFYDGGRGAHLPLHKANIPAGNFKNAGAVVWTDTVNCKLIDQMAKIEDDWRNATGYTGPLVWKIPLNMFRTCFKPNAQVRQWIIDSVKVNNDPITANFVYDDNTVLQFLAKNDTISPIELVVEKERKLNLETDTMVHGWKQNIAVLCPAGFVGEIQYTDQLEIKLAKKYGSSIVTKNFASLQQGLAWVIATTLNNGNYKEWHTDLIMSAVPSLTEFPYHVIVDTTTAD